MGVQVAVAGASGYAGGELLRLLAGHPDLELTTVSAGSNAGQPITSIHPNLTGHPAFDGQDFAPTSSATLGEAELIFMALPHSESAKLAEQLPAARIVDLSADFRLGDEDAWHQFYGNDVSYAGRWAYGLPELPSAPGQPSAKENIKKARTVAAPGCYATTSILALAPLLAAGLVEPADIVIVAASGTSGAGRVLQYNLLASEIMGSMSAYKVGGLHRHTPEIEQALSEATPGKDKVTLSFTPTLAPMPRGILATSTARLTEKARTTDATETLRKAFKTAYQNSPFVHLLPEGQWPATASVYGSNGAHVQVAADPHAGRAVVISTTDNLGKGAAGQAVQIANLMLGLPEAAGLTTHGVAP